MSKPNKTELPDDPMAALSAIAATLDEIRTAQAEQAAEADRRLSALEDLATDPATEEAEAETPSQTVEARDVVATPPQASGLTEEQLTALIGRSVAAAFQANASANGTPVTSPAPTEGQGTESGGDDWVSKPLTLPKSDYIRKCSQVDNDPSAAIRAEIRWDRARKEKENAS